MNKDTKKWFFNLDERIDRIDDSYNKRIKKLENKVDELDRFARRIYEDKKKDIDMLLKIAYNLEDKVDELEAQERSITKVINMNAEDIAKLINNMEDK